MPAQTKLALKHRKRSQSSRKTQFDDLKKDLENDCREKGAVENQEEGVSPRKELKRAGEAHEVSAQYSATRRALHHAVPDTLVGREAEMDAIVSFLDRASSARAGASMYISGPPGTGKTACLSHVLNMKKVKKAVFVNCMTVDSGPAIYSKLVRELIPSKAKCSTREADRLLEKKFTTSKELILVVLDEIDHLDSKTQEVLYSICEWPHLPNSKLVLIGIANSLDLTDRLLPRLKANARCQPELVHFKAYSKAQIVEILQQRLGGGGQGADHGSVLDPRAVQFCAAKVSGVAGDMRKALDICRRAVDLAAAASARRAVLGARNSGVGSLQGCPSTPAGASIPRVGVAQIASVLSEVYGSGLIKAAGGDGLPTQQKILVCTLLLLCKETKKHVHTVAKFHEVFQAVTAKYGGSSDVGEFFQMCQLVESRGLITMKKAKETISYQVSLRIDEQEAERVLQDKTLLTSILNGGIPSR